MRYSQVITPDRETYTYGEGTETYIYFEILASVVVDGLIVGHW